MPGGEARLSPEEAQHALRVLRLAPGDAVELLDGREAYAGTLTRVERQAVWARVGERLPSRETAVRVTLCQGLAKADKMDWIVQKCTELGVYGFQPLRMARCVTRMAADDPRVLERWPRIAREAAKQCGRARVPGIAAPAAVDALDALWARQHRILVPWEGEHTCDLRRALDEPARAGSPEAALDGRGEHIALVIGPEGGIAEEEVAQLCALGARTVTLGPRILRTETAGMAALAALLALRGELA